MYIHVFRFILADDRQDIDILKFIADPIQMVNHSTHITHIIHTYCTHPHTYLTHSQISLLSQAVYIGCSSCTKPLVMVSIIIY